MENGSFNKLIDIVERLRKDCPWDRKQTFDSLKAQTLEEVYEVIESIDNKHYHELKKELGDLLLHIIFYSSMASEKSYFTLEEVINSIIEKLIRRHPHVFGEKSLNTEEEVKQNWEITKLQEGRSSILEGVPNSLPGLQRAERLQEKASKVGFDWEKKEDVWEKVLEEINELKEIEDSGNKEEMEKEAGDIFFALVNYCRFLKINPENALRYTNEKFIKRFTYVEEKIKSSGRNISESNLKEMDIFWNESKEFIK